MSTTVAQTPTPTTCQAPMDDVTHTDAGNQSVQSDQTHHNLFLDRLIHTLFYCFTAKMRLIHTFICRSVALKMNQSPLCFLRAWTGVPLWYALLRWSSFAVLLICPCIVIKCAKRRHRRHIKKKRRRTKKRKVKQLPRFAEWALFYSGVLWES